MVLLKKAFNAIFKKFKNTCFGNQCDYWQFLRASGFSVIKLFFFVIDEEAKKAKVLVPAIPFQPGLIFVGNTSRGSRKTFLA
jgi:hypothetical protein